MSELQDRLLAFQSRYEQTAQPCHWTFTRADLAALLAKWAHGLYWTVSENDPITAPFYNFGKGSQALYRQPQSHKQMAVSLRCVRE